MKIETYRNAINKCIRCGFCLDFTELGKLRMCPVNDINGFQSYSAKGILVLASALLDGRLKYDEEIAKHVFMCSDCGACEQNCFFFLELGDISSALKEDAVERGLSMKEHVSMLHNVQKTGNIFGQPPEKRLQWFTEKPKKKAETVYFVGCTSSLARTRIARTNYKIMKSSGLDFTVLEREECCGFPLLSIGQIEPAKAFVKHCVEEIERVGAQRVVFSCPGCYRMFKKEYPRLFGSLPFEAIHSTELYEELLDSGKLVMKKEFPATVTYHDPCHLGRHMGVYEPPRKILEHVPSLKVIEMPRSRVNTYCCGAGGGNLPQAFPDISARIALKRTEEANNTGAQILTSACPACISNFMQANKRSSRKLVIKDISEVIGETLK